MRQIRPSSMKVVAIQEDGGDLVATRSSIYGSLTYKAGVGRLVLEAHKGESVPSRRSIFGLMGFQRLEFLSLRDIALHAPPPRSTAFVVPGDFAPRVARDPNFGGVDGQNELVVERGRTAATVSGGDQDSWRQSSMIAS